MSYPCYGWQNPIPGRRYNNYGPDAAQDRIALRRERAEHHSRTWRQMASYYGQMETTNGVHQRWCSQDSRGRALRQERAHSSPIEVRRQRLKDKLSVEEELYQVEVAAGGARSSTGASPVTGRCSAAASCSRQLQQLDSVRQQLSERNFRRQIELQATARNKLEKHWKLNNALLREIESEQLTAEAREVWKQQITDRLEREEQERLREQREEEARQLVQKEEERRRKEQDERHTQKVLQMRQDLEAQIKHQREMSDQLSELSAQESKLLKCAQHLEREMEKRARSEQLRKKQLLRIDHVRQSNAKLLQKSMQVQTTLSEEIDFIDKILLSGEAERQLMGEMAARADARHLRNILCQQRRLENDRRSSSRLLFSEEAECVWQRREKEWRREEEARQQLMRDVVNSWSGQLQEQLQQRQRQLQLLREQHQLALLQAEQKQNQLQEEEQRATAEKQQQLVTTWKKQIDEQDLCKTLEKHATLEQLRHQQQEDARELARIREQLSQLHCSSRVFQQFERQQSMGRRIVW